MISIFLINVEKLNDDRLFEKYYAQMSEYRKNKIDRMKPRINKNQSLGVGIITDRYLALRGLRERDMLYFQTTDGKPYFLNRPEIYFNASHSGYTAICAFSKHAVGCDIQRLSDFDVEIAKRFFTKNESDYIFATEEKAEQRDRFFRLWTLKESFLKCTGKGLGGGLSSFEICFDGEKIYAKQNNARTAYRFKEYKIPGYRIAVCSKSCDFSEEIEIIEL